VAQSGRAGHLVQTSFSACRVTNLTGQKPGVEGERDLMRREERISGAEPRLACMRGHGGGGRHVRLLESRGVNGQRHGPLHDKGPPNVVREGPMPVEH
jgi:hypothetical protein